ncbi:glycosyl hydrolase, partial [Mycolicibacterium flavescens]
MVPGDDYVDVLGVDGYNWGVRLTSTRWTEPEELFGAALEELRALAPAKPILVTEVGCAESGGSKANWVRRLIEYLDRQHDVIGFVWFEHDKETDWRITSSPSSARAMADALARSRGGRA